VVVTKMMSMIQVEMPCLQLRGPGDAFDNEEGLKEWIWQNHKEKILDAVKIRACAPPAERKRGASPNASRKQLGLLDTISQCHKMFLQSEPLDVVFACLLDGLLNISESECGFMGELKKDDKEGTTYLKFHARDNSEHTISKRDRQFYRHPDVRFYDLNNLFGLAITSKEPVLSNDPRNDKRSKGAPRGHPALHSFLGIPYFNQRGEVIGMVGVANKTGGYTEADIEALEPFCLTCSNIIESYLQIQRNEHLIKTLELKVAERTTKLERTNKELEDANERVTKASAAQMQHFACMSHEIRTPLNCIIGLSSLIEDSGLLNPMQEESLKMIVSSGDLLLTVVNDVLDYSKLVTGNVEIEIQRRNLQETLNAVVYSIMARAQGKQLTVRTHYDVMLPEHVNTDSRRLQQILFNLLGNAIKFSVTGGQVELGVTLCRHACANLKPSSCDCCCGDQLDNGENREDRRERSTCASVSPGLIPPSSTVKVDDENDRYILRFVVKDYGKGINKKDFERIFEPFRQASAETEDVYGGTGLGLAITARLVHGLGGTISVDSEEGLWSQFTVDLPLVMGDKPVDMGAISTRLKDTTIYYIDDNDDVAAKVTHSFNEYQADFVRFRSPLEMKEFTMSQSGGCGAFNSRRPNIICLCSEELYDKGMNASLTELSKKVVVLTFGPRRTVSESQGHYRSLDRILPSVLMNSMAMYLDASLTNNGNSVVLAKSKLKVERALYRDYRVLIAEDNSVNQKVLVRMLKRMELHDIVVVDNGLKAVDREAAEPFDIVLMDMQMPVMDGIEATKRIVGRQEGDHPVASVVFVTAHVSSSYEAMCEKAGGVDFLPKPVNLENIEKCFQRVHSIREKMESR
jgi:signal transduction histidine kinase/ActR/RegA family two-component response regulator